MASPRKPDLRPRSGFSSDDGVVPGPATTTASTFRDYGTLFGKAQARRLPKMTDLMRDQ